jgi:hypothetical protein
VKLTRIYADAVGESHFAAGDAPLADVSLFPQLPPFGVTRLAGANPLKLFAAPASLEVFAFHTAPERQPAVSLNGWVEYQTSDGEMRRFQPGEVVLVEDLTGRGHITCFDAGEQWFLHIPVPDDWHLA